MPPAHIIFDCDGVLVDSEGLANEVFGEMLQELGLTLTSLEMEQRFTGLTDADIWQEVERTWGLRQPADFDERYWEQLAATFDARLEPVAGIRRVLADLHTPASVASNSSLTRLHHALALTELDGFFEGRIHSADQVALPKPAPDLYIRAARAAAADPASCLVIEDSPSGVRAARAAGMPVIGFTGAGHCPPGHAAKLISAGAGTVVASHSELAPLLAAQ